MGGEREERGVQVGPMEEGQEHKKGWKKESSFPWPRPVELMLGLPTGWELGLNLWTEALVVSTHDAGQASVLFLMCAQCNPYPERRSVNVCSIY